MKMQVYYVVVYYNDDEEPNYVAGPMSFSDAYDEKRYREEKGFNRMFDVVSSEIEVYSS
jgi:hypothetical protein